MTVFLIDGYNLLHALRANEGRATDTPMAPGELEDERGRLLDRVASFMGATSDRAIVVFDARRQHLQPASSTARNVEVFFGSFSRSADAIIEREAYALSSEETIVVVTSDYALQKTVFLPNVVRRSSRQFVQDLHEDTIKVANLEDCTRIGHRVEDRLDPEALRRLRELRESLEHEDDSG
jgi:predicted RNA-binding protein with PIN domain